MANFRFMTYLELRFKEWQKIEGNEDRSMPIRLEGLDFDLVQVHTDFILVREGHCQIDNPNTMLPFDRIGYLELPR